MKFHTFIFQILQKMQSRMEEGVEVSIQDITKNNGVVFTGLTFTRKDINISPTIYLEDFYEKYENGKEIEDILDEINEVYEKSKMEQNMNMDFFTDYEKAKDNIVFKLIHYEKNMELLKDIPHRKYYDLAIVYYYLVDREVFTNATILIHNKHIKNWGVTEEEVYQEAYRNSPERLKSKFRGMMDILRELTDEEYMYSGTLDFNDLMNPKTVHDFEMEITRESDETGMYVLGNTIGLFGAAVILYPNVLEKCGDYFASNYYILPSSVHEVILVPDNGQISAKKLQEMVCEVNETQLEEQEFLSNSVYYFNMETKGIVQLTY